MEPAGSGNWTLTMAGTAGGTIPGFAPSHDH
jgi:hypothetical protein